MSGRGYSEDDFGGGGGYDRGSQFQDDDLPARPIPISKARILGTPWDSPVETYQREISGVAVNVGVKPLGNASEVFLRIYGRSYLGLPPNEMRDLAHALLRAADEGDARWPEGYTHSNP